jgi:hypothetical protein
MLSPAAQHVMRTTAALLNLSEHGYAPKHANQYEMMLAKLHDDKRRLKAVQSMEKKAEIKRDILPHYIPWVEGVLTSASGCQDDVLMTVMVWRIDAGEFIGALQIARYALTHQLSLPDQYQRTTACLLAEEFSEAVFRAHTIGASVDIDSLLALESLTQNQDMPDQVRAKLHKAIGYGLMASKDNDSSEPDMESRKTALNHLRRAWQLHDKAGVKKDIESLERALKNAADLNKSAPVTGGG